MKKLALLIASAALLGQGCFAPPPAPVRPAAPPPVPTPVPTPAPGPSPSDSETPARTHNVTIKGFAFSPATLRVKRGDKIIFTNQDNVAHTSTADDRAWDSPLLGRGQSFTLDTASMVTASYGYHCTPHPNMTGTIVVE